MDRAHAEAEATRYLYFAEALAEAADIREAEARTAADEADEARVRASQTLDRTEYFDALDTWTKADREHRIARRLAAATAREAAEAARSRSRAAGRRRVLDRLPQREDDPPSQQLVERLEDEAHTLADLAAEAAAIEADARARAERAMTEAEARLDEAATACRSAADAWRALLAIEAEE